MNSSRFYYVHDPMCSWCWAHRPIWEKFEQALAERVPVQYVVGGLAEDTNQTMPAEQQQKIQAIWRQIEEEVGTEFNFDFWTRATPRRSTYPACRAVIAARWQQAQVEMIKALQHAYYLRALNPSDSSTHLQLAAELQLDVMQFRNDLHSPELAEEFSRELALAQSLPIQGFPSMVLVHQRKAYQLPLDYRRYDSALNYVDRILQVKSHDL